MKIAILQCNSIAGDIDGNAARIVAAAQQAATQGTTLCVTPELALSGVMPRNLLSQGSFVDECQKALTAMAQALAQGPSVLVGAPVPSALGLGKNAANAAVLLQGGTATVVSRKVFHAHGEAGDDARYFERGVSCGLINLGGWRFGVVLCEETWGNNSFWKISHASAHNPLMELVARGVDAIIHLGASFFDVRDEGSRKNMLSHVAARHHVHLFSANVVGGNDDAVYYGQSLIFSPTGSLLARGKTFAEDIVVLDTASTAAGSIANTEAISPLPASPEEACWQALVLGTRDYVRKSGFSQVVLGLSGGMDSALVAAVAVAAVGAENVLGVLLPSPYTSEESNVYALQLAKNLGISTHSIAIAPLMQAFEAALCPVLGIDPEHCLSAPGLAFENTQARIRGTLLMAFANAQGRILLNTGNKSEAAMGYSTLYGDAVGAIAVIGDLSKTAVYRLADWYNKSNLQARIPQEIIDRLPTAELHPGQLDSDSIPLYSILDTILDKLMGGVLHHDEAEEMSAPDADTAQLEAEVYAKVLRAEFKRRQAPMPLRLNRLCFGTGWRVPVVLRYSLAKI